MIISIKIQISGMVIVDRAGLWVFDNNKCNKKDKFNSNKNIKYDIYLFCIYI